jgi:hypothetical protein
LPTGNQIGFLASCTAFCHLENLTASRLQGQSNRSLLSKDNTLGHF